MCLLPNPAAAKPLPSDDEGWRSAALGSLDPDDGEVFLDGSASTHIIPELRRAAWAVVQWAAGKARTIRDGVVPRSLPQTSQAAEHVAAAVLARIAATGVRAYGDCYNVVQRARQGAASAREDKELYGGVWRAAISCHAGCVGRA